MQTAEERFAPMSIVATALIWIGFVPEFRRMCRERKASGTSMWFLWVVSAGLSTFYACVCEAPPLIIANISVILAFNLVAAVGNLCFAIHELRGRLREPQNPGDDVNSGCSSSSMVV